MIKLKDIRWGVIAEWGIIILMFLGVAIIFFWYCSKRDSTIAPEAVSRPKLIFKGQTMPGAEKGGERP